ncbi:MAG: hypothetical protein JWP22_4201 [Ramlibacter sp.]|nr:hypothetical protein [Ramlibacter sp.]
MLKITLGIGFLACLLAGCQHSPGPGNLTRAPLRAAYISTNTAQAVRDGNGAFRGVSADVARELGRLMQAEVQIIPLPAAADVIEAVRSGAADIGFVAPNPSRMVLAYSQTYMQVQQGFLVRQDSPVTRPEQLNRPGAVLGANTGDSVGVYLKANFPGTKVLESADYGMKETAQWLTEGRVEAFGGNRPRLRLAAAQAPGLRLLEGNLYAVPQAIAVAPDNAAMLAFVNRALGAMRSSGFLESAVQRGGVEGVSVAPAPRP